MSRFARGLPPYAEKYKVVASITTGDAAQLRSDIGKLGDRYLATLYTELPTHTRMSILADALEVEIIDRFVEQNLMIPDLDPELVPAE